jgi:hypothetical protein
VFQVCARWSFEPRLAKATVGVHARVDQSYDLADAIRGARTREGCDLPAIGVADRVSLPLAVLAHAEQHRFCGVSNP